MSTNIVFLEKQPLIHYIFEKMGEEKAAQFLSTVTKTYGLSKVLLDDFLSKPDAKYAQARYVLNVILFCPSIKAPCYLRYLKEANLVSNIKEFPQKIAKNVHSKDCKQFVIFLDGDNLSNFLSFKRLSQLRKKNDNFHVCLVLTKDIINDSMMGYEHESWLSIIYSETKEKDAADNCLCILMNRVDCLVDEQRCDFILVTRDHFHHEITAQFDNYLNRACYHANNMDGLALLLENSDNLKKRPRPIPTIESQPVLFNSAEVMKLDQDISEASSEFLIEFFTTFWMGSGKSQSAFCKANDINANNFSKHLKRKKYNTFFNQKLFEYYQSFIDNNAMCNFALRVNDNVIPVQIFESVSPTASPQNETGENRLLLIKNSYQTFTEIATEKSQVQSHPISIYDTTFLLEITDGINVNVKVMRD